MKLVFFDYNLNFGGAPRGSIDLCSNLMGAGIDVTVFDVYGANEKYHKYMREKKVPCVVIYPSDRPKYIGGRGKISKAFRAMCQLPDFLKIFKGTRSNFITHNTDVVIVNNLKSLVTVTIASAGLGVKKIFYHRGWAMPQHANSLHKFFVGRYCDALMGHSKATVENLQSTFPQMKTFYVNNYVGTVPREKPSLEKTSFTILLPAARPVYEKGHHTALEATSILRRKGITNLRLVFPGTAAHGVSDTYLDSLHAYIRQHQLEDVVDFVGWLDSLEEFILNSDVVVLPSHTEGFPRVLIESMLLHTPIIATPVGGIPEAIIDGQTGSLIEPDDSVGLAEAIEKIILNPTNAQLLAKNAYRYAIEHFSKEGQVDRVMRVLTEVLKDR